MRARPLAIGVAIGAALEFLADPRQGRRRRHELRDRGVALLRRAGRRTERAGRGVGARVYGISQSVRHRHEVPKDFDDATLTQKVETEIFRPADVPKGRINVNSQKGIVQLRGEVDRPELIQELVERTRRVQGVRDVENLLHLPGTEAPMHH